MQIELKQSQAIAWLTELDGTGVAYSLKRMKPCNKETAAAGASLVVDADWSGPQLHVHLRSDGTWHAVLRNAYSPADS